MKRKRGYGRWTDLDFAHDQHEWGSWGHRPRRGDFFGFDASGLGPRAQTVAALAVLAPVALSGVVLAFTPVWWIFTTYGWVVFPAFGLLVRGLSGVSGGERVRLSKIRTHQTRSTAEKEILEVLWQKGEMTPARAAMETSLSVAAAEAELKELAESGHLDVRARGGAIFYALWESEDRLPALTKEG